MEKTIICLANSRRPGGRCIAGKTDQGDWIRPVSRTPHQGLSTSDVAYQGHGHPEILDTMRIQFLSAAPYLHQRENHTIDDQYFWEKTGRLSPSELPLLLDKPRTLWNNGSHTRFGKNDKVAAPVAAALGNSLYLIAPKNVTVRVGIEGADFGNPRKKIRAHFIYNLQEYCLSVTDLSAEATYKNLKEGDYPLQDAYFAISLAEKNPNDEYCYKLVAGIIPVS